MGARSRGARADAVARPGPTIETTSADFPEGAARRQVRDRRGVIRRRRREPVIAPALRPFAGVTPLHPTLDPLLPEGADPARPVVVGAELRAAAVAVAVRHVVPRFSPWVVV